MNGKNLLEGHFGPVTQSLAAIKALLQWKGRASDPLPQFVELGKDEGRLVLILSNKKDVYYTTTQRACSCPAAHYHSGPCKHQRRYFPQQETAKPVSASDTIPTGKWVGGHNGPVDLLPSEERAAKASSLSAIDCHDTRDIDVAYHSIREDKIMWAALGEA
jgi:hypothetical protein